MSWIEVETKVKVTDLAKTRARIKSIATFVKKERKVDEYYGVADKGWRQKSIRLRHEGHRGYVNFKQRISYIQGVHAKREIEFEAVHKDDLMRFLNDFAFKPWIRKEKETELYHTKDGYSIELNFVKKLGWFIEIEKLCDSLGEVAHARKRIIEIREQIGFSEKDAIKEGYTKPLWKLLKKH